MIEFVGLTIFVPQGQDDERVALLAHSVRPAAQSKRDLVGLCEVIPEETSDRQSLSRFALAVPVWHLNDFVIDIP